MRTRLSSFVIIMRIIRIIFVIPGFLACGAMQIRTFDGFMEQTLVSA